MKILRRPRRLTVSVIVGFLGSCTLLGFRGNAPFDLLTIGLVYGGFVATSLLFAWWLDKYTAAVERTAKGGEESL